MRKNLVVSTHVSSFLQCRSDRKIELFQEVEGNSEINELEVGNDTKIGLVKY